jgi:hypothetical protein
MQKARSKQEFDLVQIQQDLLNGSLSINQIAKKHNTNSGMIQRIIEREGFTVSIQKTNKTIHEEFGHLSNDELFPNGFHFTSWTELLSHLKVSNKRLDSLKKFLELRGFDVSELLTPDQARKVVLSNTPPFTKEELEVLMNDYPDVKIAEMFNIPPHHIKKWIEYFNLESKPYRGKRISTEIRGFDKDYIIDVIQSNTLADCIKILNTSRNGICRFCEEENIPMPRTIFDSWLSIRSMLDDEKEKLLELNQTNTIFEISKIYNIGYEILKLWWRENDLPVKNHSYNKSKGELELLDFLNSLTPNHKFESVKYKFNDQLREIDCYSDSLKLGVEYCGEYWHDGINHQEKYLWAKEQGISLITIFHSEWNDDLKRTIIESMLKTRIGHPSIIKIPARKCTVKEIGSKEAKLFLDSSHFHGFVKAQTHLGLYYGGELLAVMSLGKNRFNNLADFEIVRFASKLNTVVVGGLSKVLRFFRSLNPNASILTFSDLRFGEGGAYERVGFEFVKTTSPNYRYYDKATNQWHSRQKFQKHKLSGLLDEFDPLLTEEENMRRNGYVKILDCGNNMFLMK